MIKQNQPVSNVTIIKLYRFYSNENWYRLHLTQESYDYLFSCCESGMCLMCVKTIAKATSNSGTYHYLLPQLLKTSGNIVQGLCTGNDVESQSIGVAVGTNFEPIFLSKMVK